MGLQPPVERENLSMQIRVSYAMQFRQLTGVPSQSIELPATSTLRDALESVCREHGEQVRAALFDSADEIQPSLLVCLNDEQMLTASDQPLQPGDEVFIMSAISGG